MNHHSHPFRTLYWRGLSLHDRIIICLHLELCSVCGRTNTPPSGFYLRIFLPIRFHDSYRYTVVGCHMALLSLIPHWFWHFITTQEFHSSLVQKQLKTPTSKIVLSWINSEQTRLNVNCAETEWSGVSWTPSLPETSVRWGYRLPWPRKRCVEATDPHNSQPQWYQQVRHTASRLYIDHLLKRCN